MNEPSFFTEEIRSLTLDRHEFTGSGPAAETRLAVGRQGRELCVYPAQFGYELQDELEFLSNRALEANIFFSGRLLAPAMPRVDNRSVRFALVRDTGVHGSRIRLLMPFSVERPGFSVGASIIRVWSNPFGPVGTPLVDAEEAAETFDNLLEALSRKDAGLPQVLVLPDLRLGRTFAQLARAIAISRNLPIQSTDIYQRPMLESYLDGEAYLEKSMPGDRLREVKRQRGLLEKQGKVTYTIARQPEDVRQRMEEFLSLEASGLKGKKRSALINDRYRSAFAREAITNLAEIDAVRVHTIDLNGRAIASMIVFIMAGEAYTWKSAFDEDFAAFFPEKILMTELTSWHLDDANIMRSDSCALPDNPIMSDVWQEREEMGTLVIGLSQNGDRDVRQVAAQLHMYSNTRNIARVIRQKIMSMTGR